MFSIRLIVCVACALSVALLALSAPVQVPITTSTTWTASYWQCQNYGAFQGEYHLCSYEQICPDGPFSTPINGMGGSDQWTPIFNYTAAGMRNAWLAVGNYDPSARLCRTHRQSGSVAGWGEESFGYAFRQFAYCCKDYPEPLLSSDTMMKVSIPPTDQWATSQYRCQQLNSRRLCNTTEICASTEDTPIGGIDEADSWTPVGDAFDEWLDVGNWDGSQTRLCTTQAQAPVTVSTNSHTARRVAFCCANDGDDDQSSISQPGASSFSMKQWCLQRLV